MIRLELSGPGVQYIADNQVYHNISFWLLPLSLLLFIFASGIENAAGVQYIADNPVYHSIITAHAILIIFLCLLFYKKRIGYICMNKYT